MSYQVIARKYRPQKFSDVLGQEHVTRTLQNAIQAKRLHHAYLFTGVRGVGKTTVARILAKALQCEKAPTVDPCNKCKNCIDITEGSHMDVREIDGASNTGVDDVREIREQLKYLPSQSKYKIYIIDEVHMLSVQAFNALLKTLEEPPPHVVFVFATTEPHKIPATILSRCQRYDFRRISVPVLVGSLKKVAAEESITVEPDAVIAIAGEAEGSMRDAQSLFDQAVAFSGNKVTYKDLKEMLGFMDRSQLRAVLTAVTEKDVTSALKIVEDVFNQGGNLVRFSQDMLALLRGLLVFKATGEAALLSDLPSEDRDFIIGSAAKLETSSWEQMFRLCYRQTEEIARSRYPKMLLETLLIQLSQVGPVKSVDEMIEKIDHLLAKDNASQAAVVTQTPPKREAPVAQPVAQPVTVSEPARANSAPAPIPNPVAKITIDPESWKKFITWLHGEKPQISSILEHGMYVGSENSVVSLQYSGGSVYSEFLTEEHRRVQLENYVEKYFGSRYRVKVDITKDEISSTDMRKAKRDADKERSKKLKEEALEHDVVKDVATMFEAEIQEINIKES